jgi:hypothetical protein
MPTPTGPQFEQLKMFMSPSEIEFSSSVDHPHETFEDVLETKLQRAHSSGLYSNIEKEGVKAPIQVIHDRRTGKNILGHGHHRYAAASALEETSQPDILVPVVHTEAKYESFGDDDYEYFDALGSVKDYDNYMNKYVKQGRGTGDRMTWQSEEGA